MRPSLRRHPLRRADAGWTQPLLLLLRLLILGAGLGVLTGTTLKLLAPKLGVAPAASAPQPAGKPRPDNNGLGRFVPKQENKALSAKLAQLASTQKDLKVAAFALVLDDGSYGQLNADVPLPAASSIKTPILLVALEALDAGKLRLNEPLSLNKTVVGGGSGWMGGQPLGTKFSMLEVATEMIRVSDNTATNLLIQRLGGKTALNARFQELGLEGTVINNWLPDLEGTNTTTARDQARSIALVETAQVLSPRSRDLFRLTLGTSRTDTLIPTGWLQGLGGGGGDVNSALLNRGVRAYNKTGDIGIAYVDSALIELADGRRAVASYMVQGPFNDPRSTNLIRSMAAATAAAFK
ncbi:MAG: serine hydrolase [Synechococcus sp.]|nr:serine hydrolase [Synechococcus sp.]